MTPRNDQDIFDAVVRHFAAQRVPALEPRGPFDNMCCYRTKTGLKCAIGALIPDKLYARRIEGMTISGLLNNFPAMCNEAGLYNCRMDLLSSLQRAHDDFHGYSGAPFLPYIWEALRKVAKTHKLDVSVLEENAVSIPL